MFGRLTRCQSKSKRQLYPTRSWCCTHKAKQQGERQWTALGVTSFWVCFYQRMELSHLVQHVVWTVDPKIAVFILLGSPLFKIRIILPHYFVAYTRCINTPLFVFCLESDHLIGDVPALRLVPQNPVQSSLAHSSPVQSGGSWEGSDFN